MANFGSLVKKDFDTLEDFNLSAGAFSGGTKKAAAVITTAAAYLE